MDDRRNPFRSPGGEPPGVVRLGSQFTPAVKLLLALYGGTFLLSILPGPISVFIRTQLVLTPSQALGPRPWQLLTAPLILYSPDPLSGLLQLFFFGLLLYSIGSAVERRLGTLPLLRVLAAAGVVAALSAAVFGRVLPGYKDLPVFLDSEPVFVVILCAFARLYGDLQVRMWGLSQPVSGRAVSYFFLGVIGVVHLLQLRFPAFFAAAAAAGVGLSIGPGGRLSPILSLRKRIKEWQLRRARRRYKVMDGGLSGTRQPKRPGDRQWLN
jgi:membrane associated rhomboid family serine protease